jgi:hypothetical protein
MAGAMRAPRFVCGACRLARRGLPARLFLFQTEFKLTEIERSREV